MNFKPLYDRVLLLRLPDQATPIFLGREKVVPTKFSVMAVGSEVQHVKVGDTVAIDLHALVTGIALEEGHFELVSGRSIIGVFPEG